MSYKIAENPDALLKAMQEHEKALASLYRAYSRRFEEYSAFWSAIAQEESRHAACLAGLQNQLKDNPDIVIVERFSTDAISHSIHYINELIERASQPDFEPINAFSLAMKLEEALLEKNFFEVLDGDGPEIRKTLDLLTRETDRHLQTLRNALNDYKAKMAKPT